MKGLPYDWLDYTIFSWALYVAAAYLDIFSWKIVALLYVGCMIALLRKRPVLDALKFSIIYILIAMFLCAYYFIGWLGFLVDAFWDIHAVKVSLRMYRTFQSLTNQN
jgi:hypothetical protein